MAQISKGDTFTNGEQVTGARLNQLVDSATLLVGAITDQPNITAGTLEATDSTIVNDSGTLKEATIGDILGSNLPIVTSSITGGAGVDITVTPAATKKFDVAGAFEAESQNIVGNSTVGGTLNVTGATTLVNLTASGTSKVNLTTDSTVVTQTVGDNTTKPASTAFVQSQLSSSNPVKAWVSFNGTGSVGVSQTIFGSSNVSSVIKDSTGVYTISFTSSISDVNYATLITSANLAIPVNVAVSSNGSAPTIKTVSQVKIQSQSTSGTFTDSAYISVLIIR